MCFRLFVCSFVCLFVKRAYAREETCAISSFAGTCMPPNSTKRHKKGEKQQKTRASSSFAGTCMPSKSTKRHKKREKPQKTRASSSFAGYSTRFRGTFSLFLARKIQKMTLHTGISCKWRYSKGFIHGLVEVKGGYSFSGWNSIFSLFKERFFVHFASTFRFPKNNFFPSLPCFSPPETPVCYSQNTIPKKSNQQQKGKHWQHIHQKKATHK